MNATKINKRFIQMSKRRIIIDQMALTSIDNFFFHTGCKKVPQFYTGAMNSFLDSLEVFQKNSTKSFNSLKICDSDLFCSYIYEKNLEKMTELELYRIVKLAIRECSDSI